VSTRSETFEIAGLQIGGGRMCVIAEIGTNHDGSLDKAKEMICASAESGADAVKFQHFRAEECYPPNIGMVDVPGGRIDFLEYLRRTEMPAAWLPELRNKCDRCGVAFLASPFDVECARELHECGVAAFKVASSEVTHFPMLDFIAGTGRPVVVSTGYSTLAEVDEAVRRLEERGAGMALLHCVSAYPTPPEACSLNVVPAMKAIFGVPTGFSDHTQDISDVPRLLAAIAGDVIEKHFTLSRSEEGPDHPFAIEPQQFSQMVEGIRDVESWPESRRKKFAAGERFKKILGCSVKRVSPLEKEIYPCEKRSIRARRNIARGETLAAGSIGVLRFTRNSRQGISPGYYSLLLGKKTARAVAQGDGVCWEDLLE
jgi:N-acetylneuraminate synthase